MLLANMIFKVYK